MHPIEMLGNRPRLVALQRADEMPFDGRVRLQRVHGGDLVDGFLYIVFTERDLPGQ